MSLSLTSTSLIFISKQMYQTQGLPFKYLLFTLLQLWREDLKIKSSKCFYGIRVERTVNVKCDRVFCKPQVLPNTRPSCTPPLYKQYPLPVAGFLPASRRDTS
jgi:hypothetical protein